MLAPEAAAKVDGILTRVLALRAESNGQSGGDMCVKVHSASSQCLISSPYLSMSRFQLAQAGPSASSSELTLHRDDITLTQKPILENLGGAAVDAPTGRIVSASAAYIEWMFAMPARSSSSEEVRDALIIAAQEWEDLFVELALQEVSADPKLTVLRQSGSSYADGVNDAVLSSVPFYAISAVAMQMYIVYEFGSWDARKSRITLGFCGETAVLMSSLAALGCYCLVGYQLTHLTMSGLFLLMGVGLDDMFVLLKTFDREDPGKSTELRLIHSMRESGASVTMTSLTNVVAFSIGSHLPFPALADFCCFLSFGVAFTFVFFLTFFIACIVLDQARVDAGQDDLVLRPLKWMKDRCTCNKNKVMVASFNQSMDDDTTSSKDGLLLGIEQYWAPALLGTPLRRVLWVAFYGLTFSLAVHAITTQDIASHRAKYGLETGSLLFDRYSILDEVFSHRSQPVEFVARGTNHPALNGTTVIESLRECIATSQFTTGAVTSWLDGFEPWLSSSGAAQPTTEAGYDALVKTWLSDPNTPPIMSTDIAWDEAGRIASTKLFHARHLGSGSIQSAQDGLDAMSSMQMCGDVSMLDVFAFSEQYEFQHKWPPDFDFFY